MSKMVLKKSNCFKTENDIKKIINSLNEEDIIKIYSKNDLFHMYSFIFSSKPRSKMKKEDIAYSIWHYFHTIDRATAFENLM